MISPEKFASLYAFDNLEKAVQSYFVSTGIFAQPPDEDDPARADWVPGTGAIACVTVREAAIFQKHTPRVTIMLNSLKPSSVPMKQIADGNGALRNYLWTGTLTLGVLTEANYGRHLELRQTVHALGEMIAPPVADQTLLLGANQFLTNQIIALCVNQQMDFTIEALDSFFGSRLDYQLTFGIPVEKILAVTE